MKLPKDINLHGEQRDDRKHSGSFQYSRFIEQMEELNKDEFADVQCAAILYEIFGFEIDFNSADHKECFPSIFKDRAVRIAYKQMLNDVKVFEIEYDQICERNRENGKKGGRPKKTQSEDQPGDLPDDARGRKAKRIVKDSHSYNEAKMLLSDQGYADDEIRAALSVKYK